MQNPHDSVWAWRFLCQNHEYVNDWEKNAKQKKQLSQGQLSLPWRQYRQTRDDQRAKKWGLYIWHDPAQDADEKIPIFWSIMPTINVKLSQNQDNEESASLSVIINRVIERGGDIAVLTLTNHDLIIRIEEKSTVVQIYIKDGKKMIDPMMAVDMPIDIVMGFNPQTRYLLNNLEFLSRSIFHYKTKQTRMEPDRLLTALRGSRSGLNYKEIATDIFGEKQVENSWDMFDTLRDGVKYRLNMAEEIVKGGYRDFVVGTRSFSRRK